MNRVRLLILNAALGPLDYRLPEGVSAPAGSVVIAPLGPRKVTGIVWDEGRLPGDPFMRKLFPDKPPPALVDVNTVYGEDAWEPYHNALANKTSPASGPASSSTAPPVPLTPTAPRPSATAPTS